MCILRRITTLAGVMALALLTSGISGAAAPLPELAKSKLEAPDTGTIYLGASPFGKEDKMNHGLFAITPSSDLKSRLISPRAIDGISLSPDGSKLAAGMLQETGAGPGDPQLAIFDAKDPGYKLLRSVFETRPGKGPQQLTRPSWAKDNVTLAMSRVGDIHLYRYSPDKAQDKVTFWAIWEGNDPQWSPTDNRLLVVGASGDGLYLLDDATKGAYQFDTKYEIWSPDASQGFRNLRTGAVTKLDGVPNDARHPAWSPDGMEIAYVSQKAVWAVAASGGSPKRLTPDGWSASSPAYSADGSFIAFARLEAEPNGGVWVMKRDGSDARQVLRTDLSHIGKIDLAWPGTILPEAEKTKTTPITCPMVKKYSFGHDLYTVYSTPKDQVHYLLSDQLPYMVGTQLPAGTRGWADLAAKGGTVQFAFAWTDLSQQRQVRCFQYPLSSIFNLDPARARAAREAGETLLSPSWMGGETIIANLEVRYQILDQLEAIVRDPKNVKQEGVDQKTGDKTFFGSSLTFEMQTFLYESSGKLLSEAGLTAKFNYRIRYPVVFVPGTGGSRLSLGSTSLWPSSLFAISDREHWGHMRLDEQGNGENIVATDLMRAYGAPLTCGPLSSAGCVYQGWLDRMKAQRYEEGTNLLLFPYDWRLDIGRHLGNLDTLVKKGLDLNYNRKADPSSTAARPPYTPQQGEKVVIITHSQGALVARAYVASSKARADGVAYIIQLAPPNYGTPKIFKTLGATGYGFETPFASPEMGKWIARNYPAAYFMLPMNAKGTVGAFMFDANGNAIADTRGELSKLSTHVFCYLNVTGCDMATWNVNMVDRAEAFHRGLLGAGLQGVKTFVVASVDRPTIVAYKRSIKRERVPVNAVEAGKDEISESALSESTLMKAGFMPPEVISQPSYKIVGTAMGGVGRVVIQYYIVEMPYYAEVIAPCGDNLVPVYSAIDLPGVEPIYVRGVTHGGMTESPVVQTIIDRLLEGVQPAGGPKPTCNSHPTQVSQGTSITASGSPANLHVYDSQGRHTGLTSAGDIEQNIPSSLFENRFGTQEVWLPYSTDAYRIVLEGVKDTNFDLRIVSGDGVRETSVDYLAVPETTTSRAEMSLTASDLGPSTVLTVDRVGDSKSVETLMPSYLNVVTAPSTPTPGPTSAGKTSASLTLPILVGALAAIGVLLAVFVVVRATAARRKPPAA